MEVTDVNIKKANKTKCNAKGVYKIIHVERTHAGPQPEMTIKCELHLFIAATILGHKHSTGCS